jgi:hypothetical protein
LKKKNIFLFIVVFYFSNKVHNQMEVTASKAAQEAATQVKQTPQTKEILPKKQLGLFQREMNEALTNKRTDEMRRMVYGNSALISTTREKGIITMTLRFAIQERDDTLIGSLLGRLSMKRDFFELMVYKGDPKYSAQIFETHIDIAVLEPKDVRFMIENGLTFLLRYLDGKFLHDAGGTKSEFDKSSTLRLYSLPNCSHYIEKIMKVIEKNVMKAIAEDENKKKKSHLPLDVVKKLKTTFAAYDIIVDGGSVLHSRNGAPNPNDLRKMIDLLKARGHSPLVVIHTSHTNVKLNPTYAPDVNKILEQSGITFITTPSGLKLNDDLFILLAYLIRADHALACSIVTRDTYTDHMDIYKNPQKNVSNDFGKYLANDLISFTNDAFGRMHVPPTQTKPYSNCIQIVEPYAYIPLFSTPTPAATTTSSMSSPEFSQILL